MKINILFILPFIFLIGCSTENPLPKSKTIVVLVDLSQSTQYEEARNNYISCIETILNDIDEGDALIVMKITDQSITDPDIPVKEKFPIFKPSSTNMLIAKKEEQEFQDQIENQKSSIRNRLKNLLMANQDYPATDILTSLDNASKAFKLFPNSKYCLIILSDMIHNDNLIKFYGKNQQYFNQLLNDFKIHKKFFNLSGIKVFVSGANAKDNTQYGMIKNFWEEYFKESKAILNDENYAATLIHFDE
ncbi:MAG: hypothetical protein FJY07_10135 [Bacteroidetes bacterium]|nr:hypothetical protein [Bacteroidota bacterium]